MKLTHALLRTMPLALTVAGVLWLAHAPAQADAVVRKANANSLVETDAPTEWRELTAKQKSVLAPLERRWATMDETARDKWLNVATRFDKLSPAEQQRVQERMTQWSRLQPQERGEARLRFQQTRQLSADERQQKWAAYQALPAQDRQDLIQQAKRKAKPVFLADNMMGPREARQAYANKRGGAQAASDKKSNVVPNAMSSTAPGPTVVSPTMVKAGAGATTNLVTQRPSPPLHQHTGLTKIAATKGFVDPVTLLPKKGAQSAAMASLPAAATTDQPQRR